MRCSMVTKPVFAALLCEENVAPEDQCGDLVYIKSARGMLGVHCRLPRDHHDHKHAAYGKDEAGNEWYVVWENKGGKKNHF